MLECGGSQKANSPGSRGSSSSSTRPAQPDVSKALARGHVPAKNPDSTGVLHAVANATKSCRMHQTRCMCLLHQDSNQCNLTACTPCQHHYTGRP
jgi:hypothetical protein